MKIIVDTNIIISALIRESITRQIITHNTSQSIEFLTINFSNEEIQKYKQYILDKAKINEDEFELILGLIKQRLTIIQDSILRLKIKEARKIMDHIDPKDTIFIAGALAIDGEIWSNDEHFKKQQKIKVWTTKEIVELLNAS
ncbi:hypothetical protein HYY69_02865 [Candidatus Woesearchaeota archaeon]|nr:hypothetical protein [Candidatus Woesearchaeota archaeon]